jgi:chromosome segregation ATPase
LKKQLEQMKKGGGGRGGAGMSKEFAQMAARQAAMREALKKKQKELQERGKGDKGLQDMIEDMEKTETELVNKTLNNQTIQRQDQILTRLLESEKAERERKEDEERKSTAAREQQNEMPPALKEYIKKRQAEIEQYQKVSPNLKPYYKNLVEEYFKTLKGGR